MGLSSIPLAVIRKAIAEEQIYATLSTRRMLTFARKVPVYDLLVPPLVVPVELKI